MSEVIHTTTPATLVREVERPVVLLVPAEGGELLEVPKPEQLQEPAQHNQLHEVQDRLVILDVAKQGPPGPPGIPGPAGGQALQRTAGGALSALIAVYELDGSVYPLDAADADHIDLLLGLTITAAAAGSPVNVQRSGAIDDAGWSWVPGRVYLGAGGALTQTPPADGFDVLVGVATSPIRLVLHLQDAIALE